MINVLMDKLKSYKISNNLLRGLPWNVKKKVICTNLCGKEMFSSNSMIFKSIFC